MDINDSETWLKIMKNWYWQELPMPQNIIQGDKWNECYTISIYHPITTVTVYNIKLLEHFFS